MNLVQEVVQEVRIYLECVRIQEMLADGLMKLLSGGAFQQFAGVAFGNGWISRPVSVRLWHRFFEVAETTEVADFL